MDDAFERALAHWLGSQFSTVSPSFRSAKIARAVLLTVVTLMLLSRGANRTAFAQDQTQRVLDINPGVASSGPAFLTVFNNVLYFTADDGQHGPELWRSDGTPTGTYIVKDIQPGANGSNQERFTVVNDQMFFRAQVDNQYELWRSDGSEANTGAFKVFADASQDYTYADNFLVVEDQFYLRVHNPAGLELWRTDGSEAGTGLVMLVTPNFNGFSDAQLGIQALGSQVFFVAADSEGDRELWSAALPAKPEVQAYLPLIAR
jgi:ELWxxDGT repeat protein